MLCNSLLAIRSPCKKYLHHTCEAAKQLQDVCPQVPFLITYVSIQSVKTDTLKLFFLKT